MVLLLMIGVTPLANDLGITLPLRRLTPMRARTQSLNPEGVYVRSYRGISPSGLMPLNAAVAR